MVEIGIYIEHLLRECAKKNKYQQCPRCTEAIGTDFDVHIKLKECIEAKPNTSRCPLCHMNIHEGEKSWREHLMGVDGCVKNPRRLQALKKSNLNLIKETKQFAKVEFLLLDKDSQQQKSVAAPTSQVNNMKKQKKK